MIITTANKRFGVMSADWNANFNYRIAGICGSKLDGYRRTTKS